MNSPLISVIVIGHNRKEFILDALKSVNNQSFDRGKYEVICVKNFIDETMDRKIERYVDRLITSDQENFGPKAAVAVSASKGEILCFLDDDDLFSHHKLKYVKNYFHDEERLSYLHNGRSSQLSNFDADVFGSPLKMRRTEYIDLGNAKKKNVLSFYRRYPDFNSSSISIRRKILEERLEILKQLIMHPDTFFFLCALEGDGVIIDDTLPLTFYRVHQSTTNHFEQPRSSFYSSKLKYYSKTEPDWATMYSFLLKPINQFLCKCDNVHNKLLKELYNVESKKTKVFETNLEFAKCFKSRNLKNMTLLILVGFLIALFPKVGRTLFYFINTRITGYL